LVVSKLELSAVLKPRHVAVAGFECKAITSGDSPYDAIPHNSGVLHSKHKRVE
jgi:hypothetical protein